MKAFGQTGAGLFVAPAAIAEHVCAHYKAKKIVRINSVSAQIYAITTERSITQPAIVAINRAALKNQMSRASTA